MCALLALAVGCGGGDGSADLEPARLTTDNAEAFAGQGVGAIAMLDSLSEMAQDFTGVFEGSAQTVPCDSGKLVANVVDNGTQGQMDAGDSALFTYQACQFGTGTDSIVLNGSMSLVCSAASGAAPGPFDYTVTVTYSGLTAVANGVTLTVNGGFKLEASSDGVSSSATVSGASLSVFASGQGQAFSGSISSFRMQASYDSATGAYSRSMNAVVSGSQLGGAVTYETTVPFAGTEPDYPDAGQLVITGAEGATVTVTAIDNTTVEIEVDLDGDPATAPEATFRTTWVALDEASA